MTAPPVPPITRGTMTMQSHSKNLQKKLESRRHALQRNIAKFLLEDDLGALFHVLHRSCPANAANGDDAPVVQDTRLNSKIVNTPKNESNVLCLLNGGSSGEKGTPSDVLIGIIERCISEVLQMQNHDGSDFVGKKENVKEYYTLHMSKAVNFAFLTLRNAHLSQQLHSLLDGHHIIDDRYLLVDTYLPQTLPHIFTNTTPVLTTPNDVRDQCPGLTFIPDFISPALEEYFLEHLEQTGWVDLRDRSVQHHGYTVLYTKTLTASSIHASTTRPQVPEWCSPLFELITTKLGRELPNQLTANKYQPGQGIAPHVDHPKKFGPTLFILSLGSGIVIEYSKKACTSTTTPNTTSPSPSQPQQPTKTVEIYLPPRSIVIMEGEARYEWLHAIRGRTVDVVNGIQLKRKTRWSMTFRTVYDDVHDD